MTELCSATYLTYDASLTTSERCQIALENCECHSPINLYKLYYCTSEESWLFFPFSVSIVFFLLIFGV